MKRCATFTLTEKKWRNVTLPNYFPFQKNFFQKLKETFFFQTILLLFPTNTTSWSQTCWDIQKYTQIHIYIYACVYVYKTELINDSKHGSYMCHYIQVFRVIWVSVYIYIYTHTHWAIGLMSRVFTNGLWDWGSIPGWVIAKTLKNGTWCHLTYHSAL